MRTGWTLTLSAAVLISTSCVPLLPPPSDVGEEIVPALQTATPDDSAAEQQRAWGEQWKANQERWDDQQRQQDEDAERAREDEQRAVDERAAEEQREIEQTNQHVLDLLTPTPGSPTPQPIETPDEIPSSY